MRCGDLLGVVLRSVIHEDDLVIRVIDLFERIEAAPEGLGAVVGADDDRGLRIRRQLDPRGHRAFPVKELPHGFERLLFRPVAAHEPERPVQDLLSAAEPFVGPRVDDRARQAAANHALDVPADHLRLLGFRMPDRVHAEFPEDERLVLREVLQAREVALEILLPVQVNVERHEIAVLREQVFGRGVARVGKKRLRIGFLPDVDQPLDELDDLPRAQPADHRRRDLVSHEVSENRRVPGIF